MGKSEVNKDCLICFQGSFKVPILRCALQKFHKLED